MLVLLAAIFVLHIACICLLLAATIHNVSDTHHSVWAGQWAGPRSLTPELFISSKSNSFLPQLHPHAIDLSPQITPVFSGAFGNCEKIKHKSNLEEALHQ